MKAHIWIIAASIGITCNAVAATVFSTEAFEGVNTGSLSASDNATDYYDSSDTTNVAIHENIAGGPTGQHLGISGNNAKHATTDAGLLNGLASETDDLVITFSLYFANTDSGTALRLLYSDDGTFGDSVNLGDFDPSTASFDAETWYSDLSVTLQDGVGGITFSDTAALRWTKTVQGSNSSNIGYIDDVTIEAVPEPSAFALLAGMFGLTWVMLRRR